MTKKGTIKRLIVLIIIFAGSELFAWGFKSHKMITQMAIYTLPQDMVPFFKGNMESLINASVQPDIRRYVVKSEAPKHYIDIDYYGDSAVSNFPRTWSKALEKYSEDTLNAYGILPFSIIQTRYNLVNAMREMDGASIIRYAADLSHYIADAHVPLHTTVNYNGQFTGQRGIHALWETRIPEIELKEYSFWVGKASYIENITDTVWKLIQNSHSNVSRVLSIEEECSIEFPDDRKYGFEAAGKYEKRVYSREYTIFYSKRLNGMVEGQMRSAIKLIGDLWFTSWVDAGQPDLRDLKIRNKKNDPKSLKDSVNTSQERAILHHE